jgi:hypothetical protein
MTRSDQDRVGLAGALDRESGQVRSSGEQLPPRIFGSCQLVIIGLSQYGG